MTFACVWKIEHVVWTTLLNTCFSGVISFNPHLTIYHSTMDLKIFVVFDTCRTTVSLSILKNAFDMIL